MEIKCSGSKNQIFSTIKAKLEDYQKRGKLQIQEVSFNDSNFEATAKGTGFTANIRCVDSSVHIDLILNFLLKPLRGKIEQEVQETVLRLLS